MLMEEIARIAGVSIATVSRVIHNSPLVTPETAKRVRTVMAEARYFPNNMATGLKSGFSGIYGLILPDITNPFFPELVKAFEVIAVEKEQEVMIANTDFHPTGLQLSIRRLLGRQVDGIALLASDADPEMIETMRINRVPLVTMERRMVSDGVGDVSIENEKGTLEAIRHLVDLGHTEIAYISGIKGENITNHRLKAFTKMMKHCGLTVYPEYVREGNYRIQGGERAMGELLSLNNPPTAVLAANDLTAIGAMRTMRERGITPGREVSIIGFDDIELSQIIDPPLTTLRVSRADLAQAFFDVLRYANKRVNIVGKQLAVSTSLVIRESTGRAIPSVRKRKISSRG
jgi:LacI family transcriptional regulator